MVDDAQVPSLLTSSETSFRKLADAAPFMIWLSGPDKQCYWFNQTWLDFTGRSLEQELGIGWLTGVHPKDKKFCLNTYESNFNKQTNFRMTYRLMRHDGVYRWIDDVGSPRFNNGLFEGYIGSCTDVTLLMDHKNDEPFTACSPVDYIQSNLALTKRELEILTHLSNGLSGPEISVILQLSIHTVAHHKKSIFSKMGTTNALKTVNIARKYNLIK